MLKILFLHQISLPLCDYPQIDEFDKKQLFEVRYLIVFFIFFFGMNFASGQIKLGIRTGLSTSSIQYNQIDILNQDGIKEFSLNVKNANYGIHGGLVLKVKKNNFIFQPEVLFNSNKVDYSFTDAPAFVLDSVFREKYQYLDIPVFFGWQKGIFKINAGPVGHIYIANSSEIQEKVASYQQKFQTFSLGWQAGFGFELWKFLIDVRYEGNFTKYGNHLQFFGNQYEFDKTPARFLVSLGFLFGEKK